MQDATLSGDIGNGPGVEGRYEGHCTTWSFKCSGAFIIGGDL